jgi:glyoxylase-like metal-dependent hydrolase (beta-lactamase superfamily II)
MNMSAENWWEDVDVIHRGDHKGNNWIIRVPLPSGRSIFGLATENVYGGDWDLGPTWNFWVQSENPFLVDTGRYGMGGRLLEMIEAAGLTARELKAVTLSHGHEDHDGGIAELTRRTGVQSWVHPIYDLLSRSYPGLAPSAHKKTFSASCWQCFMPESFTTKHCVDYHRNRMELGSRTLDGPGLPFDPAIRIHHLPGHCPDSMAFQVGEEALIVGDTVLPDITPHPSQEAFFEWTEKILPPEFGKPEEIYGLRAYLRSLKRLISLGRAHPEMIILPAHRLFYNDQWRPIGLEKRSAEIMEHHVQRCASIVAILKKDGPLEVREIVLAHFEPHLLKGFGVRMAEGEIKSHLELLEHSGDVIWEREGKVTATGSEQFERYVASL